MARYSNLKSVVTSEETELLYEQIKAKTKIKKINAMLRALKEKDMYDESIAVENLFNYLDSAPVSVEMTQKGYISTKQISTKSVTQLTGINKAISEFIKNKTSTPSGMKTLFEERRKELEMFIDDKEFVKSLSYQDIRDIYKVFKSNEYERSSRSFDSKTFFTLYTQAISEKQDKETFVKEVSHYIDFGSDDDLKKSITSIYDKYINFYTKR